MHPNVKTRHAIRLYGMAGAGMFPAVYDVMRRIPVPGGACRIRDVMPVLDDPNPCNSGAGRTDGGVQPDHRPHTTRRSYRTMT